MRRWLTNRLAVALVFGSLLLLGCSDSDPMSPTAMRCSDGGGTPADTVTLQCGGAAGNDEYLIDVALGGPSSGTTTLRGVALDVAWTPANVEFVPEATYTSPLMPGALVAIDLFQGDQGRLVVSVLQPGGEPDISVGAGASTVTRLRFRRTTSNGFGSVALTMDNTAVIAASTALEFGAGASLSNN